MTTFYVTAGFRWVLVEAKNEIDAALVAVQPLQELFADVIAKHPAYVVTIGLVRPATEDEIDFWNAHKANVERWKQQ
jgi:hypothetical protein